MNPLNESGLLTLSYRTHFFRHYLATPDLVAERLLNSLGTRPEYFRAAIAEYTCLQLGNRARHIDRMAIEWLREYPTGQIVNLGCGLETLFHRLPAGEWQGFNVDFPDVMQLRRDHSLDPEGVICIESSIFDSTWKQSLDSQRPVLLIMAGVYSYLPHEEALHMLANLRESFSNADLIFDTHSRVGRIMSNVAIKFHRLNEALFQSHEPSHWLSRVVMKESIDLADFAEFPQEKWITRASAALARRIRFSHLRWVRWKN